MKPLLVTAKEAQLLLGLSDTKVYELAKTGQLEKRYIGKGTRNFRIVYASIEAYLDGLDVDPIEEASRRTSRTTSGPRQRRPTASSGPAPSTARATRASRSRA